MKGLTKHVVGLTAYLTAYNVLEGVGWAICLIKILLGALQVLSILEVAHAAIGMVSSNPVMALLQWSGRTHALLVVLHGVPEVQSSVFGTVMLGVWAAAEVVRYPCYALTTLRICPPALTWLRYTVFIPLYPVGVVCEMALMWLALPTLRSDGRWSIRLPNAANFGFDYAIFIQVLLVLYPLLWWQLYSSMLRQRAKKLSSAKKLD